MGIFGKKWGVKKTEEQYSELMNQNKNLLNQSMNDLEKFCNSLKNGAA